MKRCPHCDEEIRDKAIKCKHCKSDLPKENIIEDIDLDNYRLKPLEEIAFNKRKKNANIYKGTKYAKCHISTTKIERKDAKPSFLDTFFGSDIIHSFFNRFDRMPAGPMDVELLFGNNMKAIETNFAIYYDDEGYEEKIEYLQSGYYDKIHRTEKGIPYFDRYNGNDKQIIKQEIQFGDHSLTPIRKGVDKYAFSELERQVSYRINIYDLIIAEKEPSLNHIPCRIDVYDIMDNIMETQLLKIFSDDNHTIINEVLDEYREGISKRFKYNEDGTIDCWEEPLVVPISKFNMNYRKNGDKIIAEYHAGTGYYYRKTYINDLLIERKVYFIETEGFLDREVEVVRNLIKLEYDSKQRIKSIVEQAFVYETQLFGKDKVTKHTAEFNFEYIDKPN